MPLNHKFKMLSLEVNLEGRKDNSATIGHTKERRTELVTKVNDILAEGWLDAKEAEMLRGRAIFFESYAFGHLANSAVKNMGRFCVESSSGKRLDSSVQGSLLLLRDRVLEAPPVVMGRPPGRCLDRLYRWSLEPGALNWKGRRPDSICSRSLLSFFSDIVSEDIAVELFKSSCNPIHELELMPVLIACSEWGPMYKGALIVCYLDDESARTALVKGSGETHCLPPYQRLCEPRGSATAQDLVWKMPQS